MVNTDDSDADSSNSGTVGWDLHAIRERRKSRDPTSTSNNESECNSEMENPTPRRPPRHAVAKAVATAVATERRSGSSLSPSPRRVTKRLFPPRSSSRRAADPPVDPPVAFVPNMQELPPLELIAAAAAATSVALHPVAAAAPPMEEVPDTRPHRAQEDFRRCNGHSLH